ncbi:hypothetical protein [Lentibacillus sp. CBA3610]|uniref:hypothetical protein n=1 Tax=Lentibacillus sp. CBA3610 TaxID=2518176 RepID=UPI0015961700|nr:hypothetical protein [Lentibacillus sp. CBA3610]QKY70151.1 hypothetical protein Len3610_11620 [Lentibacillus sp. CBA3610]
MGTDYTIGIVRDFTATANQNLSMEEWRLTLSDRLDLDCFALTEEESRLHGQLDESIFRNQIAGFYQTLGSILGEKRNPNLDYYFETFGTDITNYQTAAERITLKKGNGLHIELHFKYALLFVEGKVLVEEFYTEPLLLNWLFRNSKIENKLAGCVISGIVG